MLQALQIFRAFCFSIDLTDLQGQLDLAGHPARAVQIGYEQASTVKSEAAKLRDEQKGFRLNHPKKAYFPGFRCASKDPESPFRFEGINPS